MSRGNKSMSKFQFFDIVEGKEPPVKPETKQLPNDNDPKSKLPPIGVIELSNVTPSQMYASEGVVFVFGKVIRRTSEYLVKENLVLKIFNNKIIDEYMLFNKMFYNFILKLFNDKPYFIAIGGDFEKHFINNEEQHIMLTSIKIYKASEFVKNPETFHSNKGNIENYLSKKINLLTYINSERFYKGENIVGNVESFNHINSFAINDSFTRMVVGLDGGKIICIRGLPNILECQNKSLEIFYLSSQIEEELHITNLAFANVERNSQDIEVLYVSTSKNLYFYSFPLNDGDQIQLNTLETNADETGAYTGCITVNNETKSLVVASNSQTFIIEYINLERGACWFMEGRKQCIGYFKNYLMYILNEDKCNSLAVFDKKNKFFVYYNSSFTKIANLCCDENSIYAFIEKDGCSYIIKLNEKDNKDKFDSFYKRNFFDLAYDYAKSEGYDKKKISEISKRHAEHAYRNGDYEKSIEQFIGTINYLDPSYVIQKFLDKSKLDYLIQYLEALEKDELFKRRDPKELQDYTVLLLNCYIMQEKFPKLKDFLDSNIKEISDNDIKTAIDICLESNNKELALHIAKAKQLDEEYLRILIEEQNEIEIALNYIIAFSNPEKKFDLFCKFGEHFLKKGGKYAKDTVENIEDIIKGSIRAKNKDEDKRTQIDRTLAKIKYEEIIKIFYDNDSDLSKLLDIIIEQDKKCDKSILHRRIELYLYDKDTSNRKKILDIITNPSYQSILDGSFLLMLFKMNKFSEGVLELSSKMELKLFLLTNYMENKKYDDIMQFCKTEKQAHFWVKALKYFSDPKRNEEDPDVNMISYISQILDINLKEHIISPIVTLDILKNNKNISIDIVKNFIEKSLQIEKEGFTKDKKEFDTKYKELKKVKEDLRNLTTKSMNIKSTDCESCGISLSLPAYHFMCGHSFHEGCISSSMLDVNTGPVKCPLCDRSKFIIIRILTHI